MVLPKRLGYVHPRRHTPVYATIAVGVVSLLAITPSLELISSMINFGALVAFTFVNLSVIAYFAVRRREYRTFKHITRNIALPLIGMALTGVLWSFLHKDGLIAGMVWTGLGLVYVYVLGRITGRRVTDVDLHEGDAAEPTPTPRAGTHSGTRSRTGGYASTRAGHCVVASATKGAAAGSRFIRDPAA